MSLNCQTLEKRLVHLVKLNWQKEHLSASNSFCPCTGQHTFMETNLSADQCLISIKTVGCCFDGVNAGMPQIAYCDGHCWFVKFA